MLNVITNILGILAVPFAGYCYYALDKTSGWDFFLIVMTGMILLYVKSKGAKELINKMVDNQVIKK